MSIDESVDTSISFEDEFDKIIQEIKTRPVWPLSLGRKLQQLANYHMPISSFSDYHSGGPNWKLARDRYARIVDILFRCNQPHIAHRIMQNWWSELSAEQQKTKQRYPIASPTYWLTQVFTQVNDLGLAFRWMLLTAVHDVQSGMEDSLALQVIQATFGFSDQAAQELISIAQKCREEVGEDWSKPCAFPEDAIQRLMLSSEQSNVYTEHIALYATRHEIAPSPGYLRSLLNRLDEVPDDKKEVNQKERGKRLEAIARYLTSLLPGCVPRSNLLSSDKAFESDIIVANVYTQPTIISDLFGRYILIECKNYAKPVDVSRVGYFYTE